MSTNRLTRVLSLELVGSYKGHNIIRYMNRFYGIPHMLAEINPLGYDRMNPAITSASTEDMVKSKIDKVDCKNYQPLLIKSYKNYNIIKYANIFYGIPHYLGKVNLHLAELFHPAILSAETQDEIERLIIESDPSKFVQERIRKYNGYNLVRYMGNVYGLPEQFDEIDFSRNIPFTPEILGPGKQKEVEELIENNKAALSVHYGGYMPVFAKFGNCGFHPQFGHHFGNPPFGYKFTINANHSVTKAPLSVRSLLRVVKLILSILSLSLRSFSKGAKISAIVQFIKTRDFRSQMMLPNKLNLLFLPSVPYTYNQHDWIIEVEDTTSMFFPFVHNGQTGGIDIQNEPFFPIFRALIESKKCKGIITHIKSTAESIPKLFKNETLASKVTYSQFGICLPPKLNLRNRKDKVDILFTNSWHQDPRSFFLRGGIDVLEAFEIINEKYPQCRLILRTSLKENLLEERYKEIIGKCNIEVLDCFLSKAQWDVLFNSSDIYVLPSARIHVVSMLEAMGYGLPVVVADGWGVEEYVEDGINGFIVRGRYGKSSWMEEKTGILRENYEYLYKADHVIVNGLVDALSRLVEDKSLRERIGAQARKDVEERYNLKNWNQGLKTALDAAFKER